MQTKRQIQETLNQLGIRPLKRFGQNFLIDGNLMRRVVTEGNVGPDDHVLEVGGGTGGLTDLLAVTAKRVACVEVDATLAGFLRGRFAHAPHVTIVEGDVLEGKHRLAAPVADTLRSWSDDGNGMVKLVANLPYQVATPLVMNLLIDYPHIQELVFSVQTEVALRITASPGQKAYGPLSVVSQLSADCKIVASLPPQAFWPEPAVDSALMHLTVRRDRLQVADRQALFRFVRGAFEHRRKMLRSALAFVLEPAALARAADCFDLSRRPETLDKDEWVALFEASRVAPRAD